MHRTDDFVTESRTLFCTSPTTFVPYEAVEGLEDKAGIDYTVLYS